ncbi:MAG: quinone oxidoreductase family protein, partial [Betaproteobacteria bacterium]
MKTEAIIVSRHGGHDVLELAEVEVPEPGPGEVRIRQHAIGVNFIDIYYRTGLYPAATPHGLGFEGAGEVEAVGAGVGFLKPGDRVAYPQGPLGAYARARTMPAATVVKLPRGISYEQAAAVMLKGLTVQYLFRQTYRLQGTETILFHAAAGGVGLIACQWARALGVKLIGTVSSPAKAKLAMEHGAWATIDYSRENFVERVKELTGGAKVPVVYDGVGKDTWEGSLDCLQPRGLMVSFGNASGAVTGVNLGILAAKGSLFVTRPTLATHVTPRARLEGAAEELFDMMVRGKIKVEVDQRYALADAAQAHSALAGRKPTGSAGLVRWSRA